MRLAAALTALTLALGGCRHVPTEKEKQGATIHYDLGIQAQTSGNVQEAYKEFEEALRLDPYFPQAHNAIALLLHLSFKRHDEAIEHYRKALELKPDFSEVRTNLGNVYLDLARYDEAIALYEQALNDMLYPTPYIAQGNLGWALYKKGDVKGALENIKSAVTTNPKFCLGFKNLGLIQDGQGETADACKSFTRYREACPDAADAHYREGLCAAKLGETAKASAAFAACQTKAGEHSPLREDCKRLLDALNP